ARHQRADQRPGSSGRTTEGNDLAMKTRIICAAAFLACLITAPAVRADVFSSDDERDKEKQQAKIEREEDLYDEGNDAIDEHDWKRAARAFQKVAEMKMSHADAALYWLAFS